MKKGIVALIILPIFTLANDVENESSKELLIRSSEKKALVQVDKLLKKYKGTQLEAGLLLRKGVLYQKRGKSARYFQFHQKEKGFSLLPPEVRNEKHRSFLKKAIRTFKKARYKYPKFEKSDEVIFNIAFSYKQLGKLSRAKEYFLRLCQLFPNSKLTPDSYLAAGEIEYERHKFTQAMHNYQKVKKEEGSFSYIYAGYKKSWAMFNLGQAKQALAQLEEVINMHKEKDFLKSGFDIRPDVLKDMVLFFADVKKWDEAISYFQEQAQKESEKYVFMLGRTYKYRSQWNTMNLLFHDFINHYATSEHLKDVYGDLLESYNSLKKYPDSVRVMGEFKKCCSEKNKKEFLNQSQKYAVMWHKYWKKTNQKNFSKFSETAYEHYLSVKEKGQTRDKVNFQLAELLFGAKKYEKASRVYHEVAQSIVDPVLSHDAPYGAIVSFEKYMENQKWSDEKVQNFNALIDLYRQRNPNGKYLSDLTFKQALIAYERKDLVKAGPLFKVIGDEKDITKKVIQAQDIYLKILSETKQYKELSKVLKAWMYRGENNERKSKLKGLLLQAEFSYIETVREFGDLKKTNRLLDEYIKSHKKHELVEKAKWNQIHVLIDLKEMNLAAEKSVEFAKKYPNSSYAENAIKIAISYYEQIGELQFAGMGLENLWLVSGKKNDEHLMSAARFYNLVGQKKDAERVYKKVFEHMKNRDDKSKKSYQVELFESWLDVSGDRQGVLQEMEKVSAPSIQALQYYIKAKKAFDAKDYSEAFRLSKKVLSLKEAKTYWKAESRWIQASILAKEFHQQSIRTNSLSRISLVLSIKTEKMNKARKALQATIRYGASEFVAKSYLELGLLYKSYVRSISDITFPKELAEKDRKVLHSEFDQMVLPMEDQAAQSFVEGVKFATQNNVFTEEAKQLQKELDLINMTPNTVDESPVKVSFKSIAPEWRNPL